MSLPLRTSALAAVVFCLAAVLGPPPVAAQIPDTFENLEVLDSGISKGELVGVMRSWTGALGVRCAHCHVGPDNLEGMDFASDEKAAKRTARRMLEMTRALDQKHLADLPVHAEPGRVPAPAVGCYTCHRGMAVPPLPIEDELAAARSAGGVDGALARFDDLAAAHAEAGRYDLRPQALFVLARSILEQGEPAEAHRVLDQLLERHPDFADAWVLKAQAALVAGDLEAAERHLAAAREIEPDNGFAAWMDGRLAAARAAAAAEDTSEEGTAEPGG